jgi:hypothetical protein
MTTTKTKKATPTEDALMHARDEVTRLNESEARLALAILRKSEELVGVKAARGDLILKAADQDGAARDAGRQVTDLKEEIDSLDACRRLARHLNVSLRDLDRALWQWQVETFARS